jgi:hypothetical protein
LLDRALALTTRQQVDEELLNQHRLAAILGEPALDGKGQFRSWAASPLRLPEAAQKHLHRVAALHRREQITALGLLDTLAELSAAAHDLPVGHTATEEIERRRPTRAELAFSTAVEELTESTQDGVPGEGDPRTPPGGRRSDAEGHWSEHEPNPSGPDQRNYREQFFTE